MLNRADFLAAKSFFDQALLQAFLTTDQDSIYKITEAEMAHLLLISITVLGLEGSTLLFYNCPTKPHAIFTFDLILLAHRPQCFNTPRKERKETHHHGDLKNMPSGVSPSVGIHTITMQCGKFCDPTV